MQDHDPSPFASFAAPQKSALAELRQRQRDERLWRRRLVQLSAAAVLGASLGASADACLRAGTPGVLGAALLHATLRAAAGLLVGLVLGAVGFATMTAAGQAGAEGQLARGHPMAVLRTLLVAFAALGATAGAAVGSVAAVQPPRGAGESALAGAFVAAVLGGGLGLGGWLLALGRARRREQARAAGDLAAVGREVAAFEQRLADIRADLGARAEGMAVAPEEFPEGDLGAASEAPPGALAAEDVLPALLRADSSFAAELQRLDAEGGSPGLMGTVMPAFAGHLVGRLRRGEDAALAAVFAEVERLIREGDDEALGAVTVGLLESLHNRASWEPFGTGRVLPLLGPRSARVFRVFAWLFRGGRQVSDLPGEEVARAEPAIRAIARCPPRPGGL